MASVNIAGAFRGSAMKVSLCRKFLQAANNFQVVNRSAILFRSDAMSAAGVYRATGSEILAKFFTDIIFATAALAACRSYVIPFAQLSRPIYN